jgi:hypothetical protein
MSSLRTLDNQKLRTRRIIATATITVVTIALLVLSDTSSATADPSYQGAVEQVPSEPPAAYQNPDDPTAEKVQTTFTAGPVRPQEE